VRELVEAYRRPEISREAEGRLRTVAERAAAKAGLEKLPGI
jgi:hypothetical protein